VPVREIADNPAVAGLTRLGVFFDGVGPDSSAEELRGAAPKHPVFRLARRCLSPNLAK
jgi:hypothetical protein